MKNHKLEGSSYISQKDLAEALKTNFPSVFSDGKVDSEKLKLALGEDYQLANERYGLSWAGKSGCFEEIQKGTTTTLKPKEDESVNFDKTGNVFIEGDNLEVLKVLQRSYYGKIKCIYIDPPYNTGNDFIYNDNFRKTRKEELEDSGDLDENGDLTRADGLSVNRKDSNGHFHSDWLNMMYPRLFLARNLLKQDGVIFVSIDDNEVHNLKMIMSEIFGEENFVAQLVWENKEGGGGSDSKYFRIKHEYILCYARNLEFLEIKGIEINNLKRYTLSDEFEDERGKYYLHKLGMGSIQYSSSLDFPIIAPDGSEIYPSTNKKRACWRWSNNKVKWGMKNKFIVIKKDMKSNWQVYTKQYLNCDNEGKFIERTNRPMGVVEKFSSTQASKAIQNLFDGKKFFEYPKPVELISYLISLVTKKEDYIVDFFAGSGTTAQAVMEQNAEDGGNRKWICAQLPELCDEKNEAFKAGYKNIAEIAKERIRRAGKKIKEERKNVDTGFKSFRLDKSNFKIWQGKFKDEESLLTALDDFVDNLEKGSNKENILYELILKSGLDFNVSIKEKELENEKYFDLGSGKLFIYLGENISIKMAEKFIEMRPEKIICLERAFKNNDELKTNILLQAEQEDIDFKVV